MPASLSRMDVTRIFEKLVMGGNLRECQYHASHDSDSYISLELLVDLEQCRTEPLLYECITVMGFTKAQSLPLGCTRYVLKRHRFDITVSSYRREILPRLSTELFIGANHELKSKLPSDVFFTTGFKSDNQVKYYDLIGGEAQDKREHWEEILERKRRMRHGF